MLSFLYERNENPSSLLPSSKREQISLISQNYSLSQIQNRKLSPHLHPNRCRSQLIIGFTLPITLNVEVTFWYSNSPWQSHKIPLLASQSPLPNCALFTSLAFLSCIWVKMHTICLLWEKHNQ